jgi:diguanylate cyclase (GGDEF)-like protein/PAS domain S-box-containing protein
MNYVANSEISKTTVHAEVANYLYFGNTGALLTGSAIAVLLVAMAWGVTTPALSIGWLVLVELVYLYRLILARSYQKLQIASENAKVWLSRFRMGAIASGIVWGVGVYLFFSPSDIVEQSLLSMFVAGVAAGGVMAYVIDSVTLAGFVIPLVSPLAARLLYEDTPISVTMNLGVILFLGYILIGTRRNRADILEKIRLRISSMHREQTVHEQNEFLSAILENEPECVKVIAANGELLQMNQAGLAMLEVDNVDEARRIGLQEFILPEHRKAFANLHKSVCRGKTGQLEFQVKGKKGSVRWLETHAAPLRDGNGQVIALLGVTRDITEHKYAEASLQKSELRYRTLVEATFEGIVITSEGRILDANEQLTQMLGYELQEMVGKPVTDFIAPEDLDRVMANIVSGTESHIEHSLLRKDGSRIMVEVHGQTIQQAGITIRLTAIRDISERKQVEQTLQFISQHGWMENEEPFIPALARYFAGFLGVDFVFVGKLLEDQATVETIAFLAKGNIIDNFRYALSGSPCETVIGHDLCIYPQDVRKQFPRDRSLAERGVESYGGIPLWNSKGKALGLLAVMHSAKLENVNLVSSQLQLASARVAAELERSESEQTEKELLRTITLLNRCDSLLMRANDEHELLTGICRLAVEVGGHLMAWVGVAREDKAKSVQPVARYGCEQTYLESLMITWDDEPQGQGPVCAAIRTGTTSVVQDVLDSSTTAHFREDAIKCGYRSCIGLPLMVKGRATGALAIYSGEANAFGAEEVRLLEDLSNDLSFGIQALRARTERDAAISALNKESEKNLALLRNASDGIHILDNDGNIIETSDSFCEMLGYRRDEMIGMNLSRWDAGFATPEELRTAFRSQFLQKTRSQFETRHRRKDGTVFDVEVSGFPLELEGRQVLFNSSRDITERKRMVNALREGEEKLRTLYELSPLGIALTDMNGRYIEFNEAFRRICGYPEEELKALDYWVLTPRKYEGDEAQQLESLRKTGHYGPYEKEYVRKDGSRIPLRLNGVLVTGRDGQQYIWSIVEDITETRQAEENLRIAATAFESQEGMLITNARNEILRVNRSFTNITGYKAEEVIGKNPRLLNSGRQDAGFYAAMWESINTVGAWEGEIWNRRKNGEVYPERLSITAVKDSDGTVSNYVATLSDITRSKAAEEEIKYLAFYDPLTHLPNRRLLMDRLRQALASTARSGRQGAILFIDLDHFKDLNDTLGHDMGDLLLQQAAHRLRACVREDDTVSRLGGDEFVVILEELSVQSIEAAAQTEAVCEKIHLALNQPYQLETYESRSTASIGVVLFGDRHQSIEELMKQADIALYQAKDAGRNTLRFFDPQMQDAINARAALEEELHRALVNQQFRLYYQIQVDSAGHPVGAETLIRWMRPKHGLVSPAQFIQLAEDTGLILPIGQWVLDEACAQISKWQGVPATSDLVLAVNVSGRQFRQPDFAEQVQATVQRHGISPMRLKLELTESVVLENIEDTIAKMSALKEFGVRLSLDDFGTGYSSLSYLKRLPLDQIKVDQSFVRDITIDKGDVVMVRTIVDLGMNFELDVIAEGVETEAQFKLLQRYGCTGFQGYLFGKPMPVDEFEKLIVGG